MLAIDDLCVQASIPIVDGLHTLASMLVVNGLRMLEGGALPCA
jgi:hypothetical protein